MSESKPELAEFCRQVTSQSPNKLAPDHKLGDRLVCPEYSKSIPEIKTFPLPADERIFALCWNITSDSAVYSTMCPSPEPFCYHRFFDSGTLTQLHTHDYIELAYVADGEFRQKILGRDIVFQKGDLCLVDKNCLHQDYLCKEPAVILFIGIANDMFSEIMDENITTQKIIAFLQSALLKQKDVRQYLHFKPGSTAGCEMENCLFMILKELYKRNVGYHHICKGLLLRIFRTLSTEYDFFLSGEQRKTMSWIIFEEISYYIQRNYVHITIQELVDTFHFQEDYFNRLIKNNTGLTYSAYVQQIRLEKAEKLLTGTQKSVEEIAELVGYHNKGYFYKIFRQKYGMTPSRYKKALTVQK
ncbi:AraC family transcriptional regulator [Clostridium sp. C105KSO13]|uniref:AraC family transcriptional regulator n=1 Tax=Clostridium sp. C105KSO13 TaxID=1776045 RepID=UPI000740834D|nr:AraC family transcriptional regulator [Clostridium sp. C105KSO13]CUX51369.1 Bifunctional transcriptional activator/DNA repair enzyme AdaA [Clostridium sp. C105KSO13]